MARNLWKLLGTGKHGTNDNAAGAVWSLPVNDDNRVTLMQLGAAPKLLKLLREDTPYAKYHVVGAFWNRRPMRTTR